MAEIESRTISVASLIRNVRKGVWRVPRFQRGFVWNHAQVLQLLDSIRKRYPTGTLFVWQTPERYASYHQVGAVSTPVDSPATPAEVGYILDGHQRVSCLVGVLGLTEDEAQQLKGDKAIFLVYYDLKERKFVHARHPAPHHLPARLLLSLAHIDPSTPGPDPLSDWIEERREATEPRSAARATWDAYRRDALAVQTALGQYTVRFDDVKEATLTDAKDIFHLVNRQGTPILPDEVFAALTWTPGGFDFQQQASELLQGLGGFEELDRSVVQRALLSSLGESVYERDWQQVQRRHAEALPEQLLRVADALTRAVDWLQSVVCVRHHRSLPYTPQLVVLTRFFEACPQPDSAQEARLGAWFWATTYGAVYGGAGGLSIDTHIQRALRLASGAAIDILPQRPYLQPLPHKAHPRSARVRGWHLFLASRQPLHPQTGAPIQDPLGRGMSDVRTVCTGERVNILAGRFLLGAVRNPRRCLLDADRKLHRKAILDSHLLTEEAFAALVQDRDEDLIRLRRSHMVAEEEEFALQFVAKPEEVIDIPEEAIIDTEDEG